MRKKTEREKNTKRKKIAQKSIKFTFKPHRETYALNGKCMRFPRVLEK